MGFMRSAPLWCLQGLWGEHVYEILGVYVENAFMRIVPLWGFRGLWGQCLYEVYGGFFRRAPIWDLCCLGGERIYEVYVVYETNISMRLICFLMREPLEESTLMKFVLFWGDRLYGGSALMSLKGLWGDLDDVYGIFEDSIFLRLIWFTKVVSLWGLWGVRLCDCSCLLSWNCVCLYATG